MREKVQEVINKLDHADAYFVTVTRKEGDTLKHWQAHSAGFLHEDLLPSLGELEMLIITAHPRLAGDA